MSIPNRLFERASESEHNFLKFDVSIVLEGGARTASSGVASGRVLGPATTAARRRRCVTLPRVYVTVTRRGKPHNRYNPK